MMTREVKPNRKNCNAIHAYRIDVLINYSVTAIRVSMQVRALLGAGVLRPRTLLARVQNEFEENAGGCPENENRRACDAHTRRIRSIDQRLLY
jgi:hypothetical protein